MDPSLYSKSNTVKEYWFIFNFNLIFFFKWKPLLKNVVTEFNEIE